MKCKYCDYENPKDAVRCECCGATLATQRSIDFYKKEAKRRRKRNPRRKQKIKEKKLQKIKRKEQRAEAKTRACNCCEKKKRRRMLISVSVIAIILIVCALLPLIPGIPVVHPNIDFSAYDSFFEDETEEPVVVYFPESGEYGFLYGGKLMETRIRSEKEPELISCHETGISLFAVTEGNGTNASVILITVSHHGVRLFTVNGIAADERTIFFYPSGNGEGFLLVIGDESQLIAYSNDLSAGTDLVYLRNYDPYEKVLFEYLTRSDVYDTVSKSYLAPYVFHSGLYMINCQTNETFAVCDRIGTLYCRGVGIANIDQSELSYFNTETCERFDASHVKAIALSPSGKTSAYTVNIPGPQSYYPIARTHSYILTNNDLVQIADDMTVISVNDSGDLVYGYNSETRSLYAADENGMTTLLCDKDLSSYVASGDSTELLFTTDSQVYLSQYGGPPTKIADGYEYVDLLKSNEDHSAPVSFIGGAWTAKSNGHYPVCTLNDDLTLKLLTEGSSYIPYAAGIGKDGSTVMISIGNALYKYTAKKDTELTLIGVTPFECISTDLLGSYRGPGLRTDSGGIFYTDASGIKTVTTKKVRSEQVLNGILLGLIANGKEASPSVLPSDTAAETEAPAKGDKAEEKKPVNGYSLFYSVNGGDLLCAMENIHHFTVKGNTLYVFVLKEYLSDERPIYDVYAGKKPGELTLIAEGVCC